MKMMESITTYFKVLLFLCFVCDNSTTPQHLQKSATLRILNAVALGIILDIDDLLFDALATTPGRHLVHQLDALPMPAMPRVRGADAKSVSWRKSAWPGCFFVAPLPLKYVEANRFSFRCDHCCNLTTECNFCGSFVHPTIHHLMQNILGDNDCLFFHWFDATFYCCRICCESVATSPKAFMSIAIPVLTLTVYFTMLQPMVDTLHDVSFAMCALARCYFFFCFLCCYSWKLALPSPQSMDFVNVSYVLLPFTSFQLLTGGGNTAFVWNLDPRGVVLLSDTPGGGWEEDEGIKSLVFDIMITTASFCGGNMMIL